MHAAPALTAVLLATTVAAGPPLDDAAKPARHLGIVGAPVGARADVGRRAAVSLDEGHSALDRLPARSLETAGSLGADGVEPSPAAVPRMHPFSANRPASTRAATIFVNADLVTGSDNGSSWADAFRGSIGLANALAIAQPGDEIWVAQGTYLPTDTTDRTISLVLTDDLTILGGFVGTETLAEQRDPDAHPTILSGDLLADDGPSFANRADNSFTVVTAIDLVGPTLLDGFTVSGGESTDDTFAPNQSLGAGAVVLRTSGLSLHRCRFTDNRAYDAAGLYVDESAVDVDTCVFDANETIEFVNVNGYGSLQRGGGAAVDDDLGSVFRDCVFFANLANRGGGLLVYDSPLLIEQCTFTDNVTVFGTIPPEETDLAVSSGGAIELSASDASIVDCDFTGNTARQGGAIGAFECRPAITDCDFTANIALGQPSSTSLGGSLGGAISIGFASALTIERCNFDQNQAQESGPDENDGSGGAIDVSRGLDFTGSAAFADIIDCTFTNNDAGFNGGAARVSGEAIAARFTRCAFDANTAELAGAVDLVGSTDSLEQSVVEDCTFTNNSAFRGGALVAFRAEPVITRSTFAGGIANEGGALFAEYSDVFVRASDFLSNSVTLGGDPPALGVGGALFITDDSSVRIEASSFRQNSAEAGGGAISAYMTDSPNPSTIDALSCEFIANTTDANGGAVQAISCPVNLTLVTCAGNAAVANGAVLYAEGLFAASTVANSILWANGADPLVTGGSAVITATTIDADVAIAGTDILNTDPQFVDPIGLDALPFSGDERLQLLDTSPLIDRANNTLIPPDAADADHDFDTLEPFSIDADRGPRLIDAPPTDTGIGSPPIADLGAHEYADCDANDADDALAILEGLDLDCNANGIPDACETIMDCDASGIDDACEFDVVGPLYRSDSGLSDQGWGFVGGGDYLWLNGFTVQPGGEQIVAVQVQWGDTVPLGTPTTVLVYDDPNDDADATDAVLIASVTVSSIETPGATFASVPVPAAYVGEAGDRFFVGAIITHPADTFPALADYEAFELDRSWSFRGPGGTVNPADLSTAGSFTNYSDRAWMIRAVSQGDCDNNGTPNYCELALGTSMDLNANGIPDECDFDCNDNDVPDDLDISGGTSQDCNANGVPDECDIAEGTSQDCNTNGVPDECDIAEGVSQDCDADGVPDECQAELLSRHYRLDDGLEETNYGFSAGADYLWMNAFAVDEGAETIAMVEFRTGNSVAPGTPVVVLLYDDPNNDANPSDAVLLAQTTVPSEVLPTGLYSLAIMPPTIVGSPGDQFFVGLKIENAPSVFPAPIDQQAAADQSWRYFASTGTLDVADPNGTGSIRKVSEFSTGAWIIRALATRDCDANAIPDRCDILSGAPDCNNNGTPDQCEVPSARVSADCDADDVPDECTLATGPNYALDDAGPNTYYQAPGGGEALWINAFQVLPDASAVSAVRFGVGSSTPVGTPITLAIYDDPNNDGDPTDAVLLASTDTLTLNNDLVGFSRAPIGPVHVGDAGDWFFVAAQLSNATEFYPAPLDRDAGAIGQSWIIVDGSVGSIDPTAIVGSSFFNVEDFDTGAWVLRALTIPDCNDDLIPDQCQPDANSNGIPDDCESTCIADLDGDDDTDVFDFNIFAPAFGTALGDPGFVEAADFDDNDTIDVFDFNIFAPDFGCPN